MNPLPGPLVSCVIPAHENLALFSRCVMSALCQDYEHVEVIVSDDSRSTVIKTFVDLLKQHHPNIVYMQGARSGNPVDNWNKGIARATGQYCVLLHHDEFLVDTAYFRQAVYALERDNAVAVVGRCDVVGVTRRSRFRAVQRLMHFLRAPLWTIYLFNWIGPTGAVLFRTKKDRHFDPRLIYTVDVDFYFELFSESPSIATLNNVVVASLGHHSAQISASCSVRAVHHRELQALRARGRPRPTALQFALLTALAWLRLRLDQVISQ